MTIPPTSSPLTARTPTWTEISDNGLSTPSSPSLLSPRAYPTWNYYVPQTAIHITGTALGMLGEVLFNTITTDATDFISELIANYNNQDQLISGGQFQYVIPNAILHLQNANNHQLTWTVVQSVVSSLTAIPELGQQYMTNFQIFDGVNQVGTGTLTSSLS
ncbi:hypothetical protein MMC08_003342 [Hypocenomyce scalaris]|nr:hypothetical protein [Hypocenomyce scalaris]